MADSKSEALTNLIQSIASATGWANTSSNSTPHSNHSSPTASTSTPPNSWRNFPMWRASGILAIFLLCVAPALAQQEMRSSTKGTSIPLPITGTVIDSNHNALDTTLSTTLAGEDVTNGVLKVEERYLTIPVGGTDAMISADQLYKSGTGYVRSITCYSDATATAGTIALRDGTAAGSGNVLWSFDVLAVAYNTPFTVDLQTPFAVGLFLDFTTTADVKCMVRYR